MSHRRYQTLAATGAAITGLAGTACAVDQLWWEAGMFAFVAVFLVEASHRESRAHRDACARARMALDADDRQPPALVPCCAFWTSTAGQLHAPTCPTR